MFTFEQKGIKFLAWYNWATTEQPIVKYSERLKDQLWETYITANAETLIIKSD